MISLRKAGRVVLFSLLIKSHDNHYIDFILMHYDYFMIYLDYINFMHTYTKSIYYTKKEKLTFKIKFHFRDCCIF